ncbi:MAG: molybdate ABC transporter substrate-binding protein [Lachnospiraceae bacterium]
MRKRVAALMLTSAMVLAMAGCSSSTLNDGTKEVTTTEAEKEVTTEGVESTGEDTESSDVLEVTTITIYAAQSLSGVVDELIGIYNETQPNVTVLTSYGSSGTLMNNIEEDNGNGACDIFFSAAQKQMNQLEEDGLLVEGTRANVVNNQVCVVTYKGSGTTVTGLENIAEASSMALADGSVPVGKYTRQAMVNAGMLPETDDVSAITTQEVSDALGGLEINECANVGVVASAVAEGSNEIGTVYKSDTYGLEDQLEILEIVSYDLTGNVIYPIAQVVNNQADEVQDAAALDFVEFLTSDTAKSVYEKYYFDTNVE